MCRLKLPLNVFANILNTYYKNHHVFYEFELPNCYSHSQIHLPEAVLVFFNIWLLFKMVFLKKKLQ